MQQIRPRGMDLLGALSRAENIRTSRENRSASLAKRERDEEVRGLSSQYLSGEDVGMELAAKDPKAYADMEAILANVSDKQKKEGLKKAKRLARIGLTFGDSPENWQRGLDFEVMQGNLTPEEANKYKGQFENIPLIINEARTVEDIIKNQELRAKEERELEGKRKLKKEEYGYKELLKEKEYEQRAKLQEEEYGLREDLEQYKSGLKGEDFGAIHEKLTAEGFERGTPEYQARAAELNTKKGQEINVYTGEERVPLTKKEYNASMKSLKGLEDRAAMLKRAGEKMAKKYLTLYGRVKSSIGRGLDKLGVEDNAAVEFNAKRSEFVQEVGQYFDQYRREITGAAASELEMQRLIDNLMNPSMGPIEFETALNAEINRIVEGIETEKQRLNEGIYTGERDTTGLMDEAERGMNSNNVTQSGSGRVFKIMEDANGNRARVYEDGSFEEI